MDIQALLDPPIVAAIYRYANDHGITFTAALSIAATHGLAADGYIIDHDQPEQEIQR